MISVSVIALYLIFRYGGKVREYTVSSSINRGYPVEGFTLVRKGLDTEKLFR